jgi:hypothetical protein
MAASVAAAATSAASAATSASSAATSASSALTSANSAATSAASAAAAVAASFDAKGDLLVGTGAGAFDQLTVAATNGYILSVNSATATGLEWSPANAGDITGVTAGNGLQGGGTSGSVTLGLDTNAKGDLIVGTGNDTSTILTVGSTNGYLLAVNSATTSGLEWQVAPAGYLAPTIGTTVITSGTTVSTITAVTLANATLSGTLTAASSTGTNGQYLKSTGTGVEWGTVTAGGGDPTPTVFLLMGA